LSHTISSQSSSALATTLACYVQQSCSSIAATVAATHTFVAATFAATKSVLI